jgi:hypothetical protein
MRTEIGLPDLPHRRRVLRYQIALLEAILHQGSATADDAVRDRVATYSAGGKWVGSATLQLARVRLIVRVEVTRSTRIPRHGGLLWRWRATDPVQVQRGLSQLRLKLALLEARCRG